MEETVKPYYPVFLHLDQRPCLVVGGGRVAERKIAGLLECGARVTVIAPRVVSAIDAKARAGELKLHRRKFCDHDLAGFVLVYAATDQAGVNARILELARQLRVPAAAVDGNWRRGDFLTPARFHYDGITVAVSSSGKSCCRSRDLKNEIRKLLLDKDQRKGNLKIDGK